jgi:hypothetical protein
MVLCLYQNIDSSIWQTRPVPPRELGFPQNIFLFSFLTNHLFLKLTVLKHLSLFVYQLHNDHEPIICYRENSRHFGSPAKPHPFGLNIKSSPTPKKKKK